MKPFGREKKLQGTGEWKRDVHPGKKFINWWEDRCKFLTRGRMKQLIEKEIKNEIN